MVEKMLKCAAKNAVFMAMDVVVPGSGYLAKRLCRMGNAFDKLGPYATPDRVTDWVDTEESLCDFAHNMISDFLDLD